MKKVMYGTAKLSDFGKTVFLTKAEAEEELRKITLGVMRLYMRNME